MTITGGIKFFSKSKALAKDGAIITASTNQGAADYALSMNRYLRWESVGSNDTIPETFVITFPSATIDRLIIAAHNLKDFDVTYGAGATSFTNVVGIDGPVVGGIVETAFTQDTAYYEFDSVTTTQINLTMNTTQVANSEKIVTLLSIMSEIGTLVGFPRVTASTRMNERRARTESNRFITQKSFESFDCRITSEHTEQADINLYNTLYETQVPFLIWLSGGKYGDDCFSVEQKNWRLRDIYQVQTFGTMRTNFRSNIYSSSPLTDLRLSEEV